MISFLLYNAGLELLSSLPPKLLKHEAFRNDRRRRNKPFSKMLLDLAVHQPALSKSMRDNRGRPDILHQCLLQFLFSSVIHPELLASEVANGSVSSVVSPRCFVHTISNQWFEVDPLWRPPVHYFRFRGLMELFLEKGFLKIASSSFLRFQQGSLEVVLDQLSPSRVLVFSSSGSEYSLSAFQEFLCSSHNSEENFVCLIGAYQRGPPPAFLFSDSRWSNMVETIKLPGQRLSSWKVFNLALSALEFGFL
ncbi:MAG: hypothetical protein ACXAC7_00385 [Candidatus Hodarchaeales archaeon]|jgi:rRNA small subunit pseudouridine methyltransferase Nep1